MSFSDLEGVVTPGESLPVIVGASGELTIRAACEYADGVNIRITDGTADLVALASELTADANFEISVHDNVDSSHEFGGTIEPWIGAGVAYRTVALAAPFDLEGIAALGHRLNA